MRQYAAGTKQVSLHSTFQPSESWPTEVTSRDFDDVCSALCLSSKDIDQRRGAHVLSIGEGYSNFAKTLHQSGVDVWAVDPIYACTREQLDQISILRPDHSCMSVEEAMNRLLPSDRRLEGRADDLPFESSCFDTVVIAFLFIWFDRSRTIEALQEALRVTAPGGRVYFNAFPTDLEEWDQQLRTTFPNSLFTPSRDGQPSASTRYLVKR